MRKRPSIIVTIALTIVVLASIRWPSPGTSPILGLAYLLWLAYLAGRWIAPAEPRRWQLLYGGLAHGALITIWGATLYWLHRLDGFSIGLLTTALPILWFWLSPEYRTTKSELWQRDPLRGQRRTMGVTTLLVAAFLGLAAYTLWLLIKSSTTEAIRTPWQALPPHFLLGYFAATLAVLTLNLRTDRSGRRLWLTLVHLAISVIVALIIFPLGYGFDPIIHQATERAIAAAGVIAPKTPYYIGQYALVITASRWLGMATTVIDRLLAPLTFLVLGLAIYHPWRRRLASAAILPLLLLALPYQSFIATTPQGLANFWLLVTALAVSLPWLHADLTVPIRWRWLAWLAALAAMVTHPIAGVPAVALVVFSWKPKHAQGTLLIRSCTLAVTAIALPLLFTLSAHRNGFAWQQVWQPTWSASHLGEVIRSLRPGLPARAAPMLDFAYAVEHGRPFLVIAFALFAAVAIGQRRMFAWPPLLTSAGMVFSYLLLSGLTFPQVATSEQSVFPSRVLELAQFALLPLLVGGAVIALERISREPVLRLTLLAVGAATLTATFYLAYPRVDRQHTDRGYNLSAADIEAVRLVANDAPGNYLVLANQMTSAAAIREFGFSPSYPAAGRAGKSVYAYPIPTSGPLYRHYLAMVYDTPSRQSAERAAATVAAEIPAVYFILNRYWDNFENIAAAATRQADRTWPVHDGKVFVFRFDQTP